MADIKAESINIRGDVVTHLYAKNRTHIDGAVEMYYYDVYAMWSGPGTLQMAAHVLAAGGFELALCCSVLAEAVDVRVEVGGRELAAAIGPTWGVWVDEDKPDYNFERVSLDGVLDLPEGPVTVTVRVTGPDGLPAKAFNLASIELTPVAAKAAIAAEQDKYMAYRASGDWFVQAGYGLMFHWGPGRTLASGQTRPWDQGCRDFDVEQWADMVEDTGARYAFVTANHGDPYFPGPLEFWESVHPGWTAPRDLIADMAEALEKRDLRLCLYLNCPTFGSLGKRADDEAGKAEYLDLVCRMFDEVGERYGSHVGGYWLDSWYQPYIKWGHFPIEQVFEHTKAGYKDRVIAFNHWVFPVPTLCQEYWASEMYQSIARPAEGRCFRAGAAKGLQYQALYSPDSHWGQPEVVDGQIVTEPLWTAEVFGEYLKTCLANEGVVTINLACFLDGTIAPKTADWMRRLRKRVGR